jgi:hypothetical protein
MQRPEQMPESNIARHRPFNETKRHILDLLRSERANQSLETMDQP